MKIGQRDGFNASELLPPLFDQLFGSVQGAVGDDEAIGVLGQKFAEDTGNGSAGAKDSDSRARKSVIEVGNQVPDQSTAIGVVRKPFIPVFK